MRRALAIGVGGAVLALCAGRADAGRTFYGWLYGTEVNPERGVEIETWLFEEDGLGANRSQSSTVWWGPTIGITDHLELAIPVELTWADPNVGMTTPRTYVDRFGAELRYRPDSPDELEAGCYTSMFRVAAKRLITDREAVRGEADAVVAWHHDRWQAEVDLGVSGEWHKGGNSFFEIRPGAGVSAEVKDDLRVGAEAYGELTVPHEESYYPRWIVAGPSLAWTHGRFWLSATAGIGLYQIRAAPRVNFAVAF
jgi:hypothetical protein